MPSVLAFVLAVLEPEIGRPRPGPGIGALGWIVMAIGVASVALVIAARRRARRSGRPQGVRSLPGGAAIGNALFDLGSMLQPDRPDAAVVRSIDEEDERDEPGDGRDPERPAP